MTVYPFAIDTDSDLIRVDDNITEIGGEAINQLRDAVFAIEKELGTNPAGSAGSVANRLSTSLAADGSIKASALTSVGLATLPISDSQVGTNAGIKEYKLSLDHTTSDLYTLIIANQALFNSLNTFAQGTRSDLDTHVGGGEVLGDGSPGRHVASHIDLNDVPSDARDTLFSWTGLLDKDGAQRSATTVAEGLLQINNELVDHQNAASNAHVGTAIDLDVDNFEAIPNTINTVQKLADYLDDFDVVTLREHRAEQHGNAVPPIARATDLTLPDGYGWQNVVPPTTCSAFLVTAPNSMPVDNISTGDDIVSFSPDNTDFIFDSQFSRVKVGDIIRINYANGTEASYPVESIRFVPGTEWVVRLNGVNLADAVGTALARIDRPLADTETAGVLAVAAANATPTGSFDSILQSAIVGDPKGATAVGNGFDPGQLDSSHYKLYLELYPTGNPADRVISLPFIDVTGNAGVTPGKYTIESVIKETNKNLREIGYNYRMIAFAYNGQFAIMMADSINNASFSITSGSNGTGTLIEGTYTENVIGDAAGDGFDALGLGQNHAAVASPAYISSFIDSTAALLPTKVIVPRKNRNYIVDGVRSDGFASTWLANSSGYWDGYISSRNPVGAFTVETTYTVELDLKQAGLKPGKTIVVQPAVEFADSLYSDVDYGRFIIKSVSFAGCAPDPAITLITVINGIHATGNGFTSSGLPTLPVKLYFGEDSVSFNTQNVIDTTPTAVDYLRLHEIFISNSKNTFSHERARMVYQSESTPLLGTTNWHIENVSPKLRGYRDTTTSFNKYVRFYILSYDSDTGEYDGYIGQRATSGNGISKVGPVKTGRKNVVTRFYDETYIDYIDLIFIDDTATSPGTPVLSDGVSGGGGTPRYADIELFDSLQLDDEMFLLATAEVNWDPGSGQDVVQRVRDRRDFGSINEDDFTNSAQEYISAGDRHIHENGVLRGLSFDFVNPSDNREIFFKGGVALVNGAVVTVNAISVTIPEIHLATDVPPATVDWAVCVNGSGNLIPIVVTAAKTQFFAKDNNSSNTYYVPSVTFNELITTRKDLTPIYVVTANIASVTINDSDVKDVRRFTTDIGLAHPLTLSGSNFIGNFTTFAAVTNWLQNFGSSGVNEVSVRGDFTISATVDLTSLTVPVKFVGDGANITITAPKGFSVGSNVSFENINFTYNPTGTYLTTDKVNSGNGCIYHGTGSDIDDVNILDCTFTSSASSGRPPFIGMELNSSEVASNISVRNCTFEDTGADGYEAAVAFVCQNGGVGVDPALVSNVLIESNYCLQKQGIYVTSSDSTGTLDLPGLSASNVVIRKNSAGVIGYLTCSDVNIPTLVSSNTGLARNDGLVISENNAHFIGTTMSDGIFLGQRANSNAEISYGLGDVTISDNKANWIITQTSDVGTQKSHLTVKNNVLRAYDLSYMTTIWPSTSGNPAIAIYTWRDEDTSACIVDGNIIDGYGVASDSLYGNGIFVSGTSTVVNNIINGFTGSGVFAAAAAVSADPRNFIIKNNTISRETRNIAAYLFLSGLSDTGTAVGNYFDSPTKDGSSTALYLVSNPDGWQIHENKNQTETAQIWFGLGTMAIGTLTQSRAVGNPSTVASYVLPTFGSTNTSPVTLRRGSGDNGSTVQFGWVVPLFGVLPENVTIISGAISITPQTTPDTLSSVSLRLHGTSTTESTTVDLLVSGPTATLTPTGVFRSTPSRFDRFVVDYSVSHSAAANVDINVSPITLIYRW